ncbi:InlB B-repeat-containing protein, partial [Candidatus Marithrix sp. Canyon 246]
MIIKCYKPLSNWLNWVVLILMMAISPIIQAATDCDAVTEISKGECESLLELYNSTDGANWKNNSGWNVTNTPCSWHGVSCSNGGVSRISLTNNELKGSTPDFSALPKLTHLYLYSNQLSGSIPNFSALPNLLELFLDRNQLTGTIHNFNALPNLQELHLHSNQLTGTIPNFNALPNLQRLYLENNQLTGTIHNFNALPNLQGLYLYNNKLTGTIPNFNALPKLEDLSLHSNQLTGTIPNFNALPNLQYLRINNNQLCKDKNTNYGNWQTKINSFPDCPTSEPQTHTLSISSGNGGNISGSTKENYNAGETVNLTATPEQCYKFTAWGGACSGTSSSCQLTMDSNKPVTANFEIQSFKLNISSDNGNVERQPNKTIYNCGETVNLTAKPNQAYKFKAFRGDANGSNQNITINMDANKNITAIFEPVTSQPTTSTNEKYAIIIAASGAHKQNSLFPYSNDLALRMYRTLFSRGYKHENIIYMNPHKWQDLHGSGRDAKIVDYELFQPQQELETAFNTAANATKQFVFYIHGHAQKDSLQINREYWLSANQLQQQLNKIAAEQIIIIDTCYSGSFINDISGTKRTILTSSDAESLAWNNSKFSETLIPALRRGYDINTAFLAAVAEIKSKQ